MIFRWVLSNYEMMKFFKISNRVKQENAIKYRDVK